MKNGYQGTAVEELGEVAGNMYAKGWAERNGGNISRLLEEEEVVQITDNRNALRTMSLGICAKEFAGKCFLVTGTGKYFRNMAKNPEKNMGVIRISKDGNNADLLWGLTDGGGVTSEFASHLATHLARFKKDPNHRVVIHTHPVNLISMSFIHEMTDKAFTNALWKTCTECILVFPEGIGVVPWMVSANEKIAALTAEKMERHRLVLWGQHGVYGTGENFDEVLGLIETVEKAAEIYLKTKKYPQLQGIDNTGLKQLAETYRLDYRKDYLDL